MRVLFSPRAALDLEEVGDYIARDNPIRACTFIDEIETYCHRIGEMPSAFIVRDDLGPGIRMAIYGKYLILFRITDAGVRIERIVHGARLIGDIVV